MMGLMLRPLGVVERTSTALIKEPVRVRQTGFFCVRPSESDSEIGFGAVFASIVAKLPGVGDAKRGVVADG